MACNSTEDASINTCKSDANDNGGYCWKTGSGYHMLVLISLPDSILASIAEDSEIPPGDESAFPWWWILVVIGTLCCICVFAFLILRNNEDKEELILECDYSEDESFMKNAKGEEDKCERRRSLSEQSSMSSLSIFSDPVARLQEAISTPFSDLLIKKPTLTAAPKATGTAPAGLPRACLQDDFSSSCSVAKNLVSGEEKYDCESQRMEKWSSSMVSETQNDALPLQIAVESHYLSSVEGEEAKRPENDCENGEESFFDLVTKFITVRLSSADGSAVPPQESADGSAVPKMIIRPDLELV